MNINSPTWAQEMEPVEHPDGTLRCAGHALERCYKCGVDYSFHRENLEVEAKNAKYRAYKKGKQQEKRVNQQESREMDPRKCIEGCSAQDGADKKCSGCKCAFYCSAEHQKQDWPSHKAACAQLAKQMELSAKLRALLTKSFTVKCEGRLVVNLDSLVPLQRYTFDWQQDGYKGSDTFKWRGTESQNHLRYNSPGAKLRYTAGANSQTSCGAARDFCYMLGRNVNVVDEEHAQLIRNGLHALVQRDIFEYQVYGLALNYTTFGTCFPWAPCRCLDHDLEEDGDEEPPENEAKRLESYKGPSEDMLFARAHFDPLFKRALANPLDVQCVWQYTATGCLAGRVCPFRHAAA